MLDIHSGNFLQVLITLVPSTAIAYFAWSQLQVAISRVEIDMLDRRLDAIERVDSFITTVYNNWQFSLSEIAELERFLKWRADPLFGNDVTTTLRELLTKAENARKLSVQVDGNSVMFATRNETRQEEMRRELEDARNEFYSLVETLPKIYSKYIHLPAVRGALNPVHRRRPLA